MKLIVFDVKTVPDIEGGRRLYGLQGLSDKDVANVMFHKQRQRGDSEGLGLPLQRIRSLSALSVDKTACQLVHYDDAMGDHESGLIEGFFSHLGDLDRDLVTWQGPELAIPLLNYRALFHGLRAPQAWWQAPHVVLPDVIDGGHGRKLPLAEMASLLGQPGESSALASMVWDQHRAGNNEAIIAACDTNVLNIYLLYLRYRVLRNQLSQGEYEQACGQLRDYLQAQEAIHLQQFIAEWQLPSFTTE